MFRPSSFFFTFQEIFHAEILDSLFELLYDEVFDGGGVLLVDLGVDQLVLLLVLVEVLVVAFQQRLLPDQDILGFMMGPIFEDPGNLAPATRQRWSNQLCSLHFLLRLLFFELFSLASWLGEV